MTAPCYVTPERPGWITDVRRALRRELRTRWLRLWLGSWAIIALGLLVTLIPPRREGIVQGIGAWLMVAGFALGLVVDLRLAAVRARQVREVYLAIRDARRDGWNPWRDRG